MLQVVDASTGKQMDVRAMLGISNHEIKDPKLREVISNYSILNSQNIGKHEQESVDDFGEYFSKLNVLEFDMGKFEDTDEEEEEKANQKAEEKKSEVRTSEGGPKKQTDQSTAWKDWWELKSLQNEKLKNAIIANDSAKVKKLLTDPDLLIQGFQADVNFKLEFNSFKMSPIMLAI